MKQTLIVSREALKERPLKALNKSQTGRPPQKRDTAALSALLKMLKHS